MKTLLEYLQGLATQAIASQFPELSELEREADVAFCAQEEFGHYQCNSALRLSKLVKMNPRAVAQKIIDGLPSELLKSAASIAIAGPGFINITLSSAFLSEQLQKMFTDSKLGASVPKKKQKIVVDFSAPNIAKELHVGHLRSTIIGDCLCRLFEFLGADVLRLNHLGDWGTQFGMLIAYMKQFVPAVLAGDQTADLSTLMSWYRSSKKHFDENPEFQKRAQLEVVQLQSGNLVSRKIWELICDISSKGYEEIYQLLDVRLESRGESFYNPFLPGIVEELEQKGLVTVSGGAKCIFVEGFQNREGEPLPLMLQKSDGGYSYDTTDMAAMKHRIFTEKADRIIIVTDNGQSTHFAMIFAAAEKAGWLDKRRVEVDHVGFGLVLGPDGKKFKTRSGDTEKLIDLLLEGIDKARDVLTEKMPEASPEEIAASAKVIGIDAIKYADLSSLRTKDYTFSYERMLRFDGNTALFLLYAYVRINGIKRKIQDSDAVLQSGRFDVQHVSEISLAIHLRRFAEILQMLVRDLCPNRLADYLYVLAEKFNAFYRDCRIEGAFEQNSRLLLAELTAHVLKQGLEILGLKTVERM
ncbi:MAG TPA: arginine--tRNA ligase [Chlamydiales bacterium]|jgi:arginyl-tRNA synthetase|nr:arginine--tRNA ligase [Chlamydiales bacterium]